MELLLLLALPLLAAALGFDLFDGGDDPQEKSNVGNGGTGDDSIRGTNDADLLAGNAGNDTLIGFGGADTLRGGVGVDVIDGGADDDFIRGGDDSDGLLGWQGNDTIYGDRGNDFVLGDEGNDLIYLGAGDDLAWVTQNNFPEGYEFGQLGDDTIYGEAGKDTVYDYVGSNKIYGGEGDDALASLDTELVGTDIRQTDLIYGGAGNDLLIGDYGDTLVGGAGNDTIRAVVETRTNVATTIEGYNSAEDTLQIYVDPSIANATAWQLAATTNAQTGDVSLFLQNIATPSTVIDLAVLKTPTDFQLSQVKLQFSADGLAPA